MKDKENRIAYIDLAKGFCIALVVFYHSKGVLGVQYLTDIFFVSFRLPLYFFLSGLFFKEYGSFHNFFIKKTNRLLIPFFFFYFCFSVLMPNILHFFLCMNFETVIGWPSLWAFIWPGQYPNVAIWFLWCLFLMNILFWIIHHMVLKYARKHHFFILFLLCFSLGITGYLLIDNSNTDYGNVFKALQNMPFFYFGYFFVNIGGLQCIQKLPKVKVIFYLMCCLIITVILTIFMSWPTICTFYLSGFIGTLFIIFLAILFQHLPLFSYIGRYSIILLLTHGILLRFMTPYYHYLSQFINVTNATFLMTVILLLSYYLIIPFMCRYFPYVTSQRPLLRE